MENETATRKTRSDAGKSRKKPRTARIIDAVTAVIAALEGLRKEDMARVLRAAEIYHNVRDRGEG